jgi:hypothetical protein
MSVNSAGVAISMFIDRFSYYRDVRAGWYNAPSFGTEVIFLFRLLPFLVASGMLQALTCCWIISRMKVRRIVIQVTLGAILGLFTAVGVSFLGAPIFWVYAFLGLWAFALSGIVFGSLVGYAQWRWVAQK